MRQKRQLQKRMIRYSGNRCVGVSYETPNPVYMLGFDSYRQKPQNPTAISVRTKLDSSLSNLQILNMVYFCSQNDVLGIIMAGDNFVDCESRDPYH